VEMTLQAQMRTMASPQRRARVLRAAPSRRYAAFRRRRHSDADFVRAARHHISHGAVEPDACDHQREDRECRAEIGEGALLGDGTVNGLRLRHDARDGNTRRGFMDGLTNGLGNRKRVALRARFEEHANERT